MKKNKNKTMNQEKLDKNKQRLESYLKRQKELGNEMFFFKDLMVALGISTTNIERIASELKKEGKIEHFSPQEFIDGTISL